MADTEIQVILEAPATPNLKQLAYSTFLALKLLRPWCELESDYSSNALNSIKCQAQAYVKAIDFSIISAQHGFTIAEEVLSFTSFMDEGTEVERQEYLIGMLDIARRGEHNAVRSHNSFRDVRIKVYKLIQDAAEEQTRLGKMSELDDLKEGVLVLESFSRCLSFYTSWWSVMKMTHTGNADRLARVVFKYDSLRYRDVIDKWRDVRRQYVDYINKIMAIQDADPQFAKLLAEARVDDRDDQLPILYEVLTESSAPRVYQENKPNYNIMFVSFLAPVRRAPNLVQIRKDLQVPPRRNGKGGGSARQHCYAGMPARTGHTIKRQGVNVNGLQISLKSVRRVPSPGTAKI
ncbi:hypothetical protein GALMADRAFT_1299497 [Galerina marginata CBS 339.88]|uniref:Uncharacterized protein n=1 Tax=Galerina marginata (strain CBS 339.88) TaxID=685588 RepID=A0A067T4L5_GALM3|nr:hypothetical protein GALMADRAFT_1299497 [Galerina marginata CBS 339.88]